MYSITCSIGYMLVVLLSYVSTSDYPFNEHRSAFSPYYFGYKTLSEILSLDVTFKNIPTSVTNVTVIRYIFQYYHYDSVPFMTPVNVNVDKKTREGEFIILEKMKYSQTWFDMELHKQTGLCYKSQIIEGRCTFYDSGVYWETTQRKAINYDNSYMKYVSDDYCFAPNVCKMEVDLSKACKDQQVSTNYDLKCMKEKSQCICTFVQDIMNYNNVVIYQTSEDNTTIDPLHVFKARGSLYLYFNFELFDNNTFVKLEATSSQNNKTTQSYKISVTEKDISEANRDVKLYKYKETTNYHFSCEEYNNTYSKIFVGVINTTDNKIIKTVTHKTRMEIKMEDNGTMLCCMLYRMRENKTNTIITRSVKNNTLLIYQSHESMTINRPETDELAKLSSSGSNWWIYLIPIISVAVLMVIIYIIIKRCWHKLRTNSRPAGGTEELNENTNTNQVLYAKLDFGRSDNETANKTEESEYATIVGVVQPFGNGRA